MNRLWVWLSIAFLVVAWLSVGAVALIVRTTTEDSFREYVNRRNAPTPDPDLITRLETFYAENGAWAGAESLLPGHSTAGETGASSQGQGQGLGQGQGRSNSRQGLVFTVTDLAGIAAASTDETLVGQPVGGGMLKTAVALVVDGQTVGWLVQQTPGTVALGAAEQDFLDALKHSVIGTAVGVALVALVLGAGLAWRLTRPLRTLTYAAEDVAAGKLGQQVTVRGAVEVNDLALAFNRMSHDLAEGEALRRRMAADIAHELRTPVSVLRAHLEALLDGVFPLDTRALAVAYDQTLHLARLVEDLRLLTSAETGQLPLERTRLPPHEIVTAALEHFAPLALDAEISLNQEIAPDLPPVWADRDRLQQVFGNLLSNALRHTPPGGQITVRALRDDHSGGVCCSIHNTGSCLTPQQQAHIFRPFWRAEEARERDRGGSGLGLAITQQLVALHGGRIWVESSSEATTFFFSLPPAPETSS